MTSILTRQPLQPLPMSTVQRGSRRESVRLHEKDRAVLEPVANGLSGRNGKVHRTAEHQNQTMTSPDNKKRKKGYEEDDDGFSFTRVKKNKTSSTTKEAQSKPTQHARGASNQDDGPKLHQREALATEEHNEPSTKKKRNKMSFSTPDTKQAQPTRRSKRLSAEHDQPQKTIQPQIPEPISDRLRESNQKHPAKKASQTLHDPEYRATKIDIIQQPNDDHSATKIALPFADTPVIRRNKAMREGKSTKGERRSSLGFRGRRASSLIETGNSNALPHSEVQIADFYKHIESTGLPEPRRMRQLLTWCATRALDAKPMGTDFEDASARSAARVIEEELLKELGNRSDLSDWFTREDVAVQNYPLPERPNPKNIQNIAKIVELEEQIARLRGQRDALTELTRPKKREQLPATDKSIPKSVLEIDKSTLSNADVSCLEDFESTRHDTASIINNFQYLQTSLQPIVDSFADGIHAISQYRSAADSVASRVLASCADKLAEREKEGRKQALLDSKTAAETPRRDLSGVLRGLSRLDR